MNIWGFKKLKIKKDIWDVDSVLKDNKPSETLDIPVISGLVVADTFGSTGTFLSPGKLNKIFMVD